MQAFQLTAARRRLRPVPTPRRPLAGCFNSQPLEGGCFETRLTEYLFIVSTHSRSKAAAFFDDRIICVVDVSTHSRSKAAASLLHVGCPH